ncbi:MAG: hypothetical protein AVDCRST_MAG41-350, partial [uncultured Corynebacteriales bacterium]
VARTTGYRGGVDAGSVLRAVRAGRGAGGGRPAGARAGPRPGADQGGGGRGEPGRLAVPQRPVPRGHAAAAAVRAGQRGGRAGGRGRARGGRTGAG